MNPCMSEIFYLEFDNQFSKSIDFGCLTLVTCENQSFICRILAVDRSILIEQIE